jgi:hypothetical protein
MAANPAAQTQAALHPDHPEESLDLPGDRTVHPAADPAAGETDRIRPGRPALLVRPVATYHLGHFDLARRSGQASPKSPRSARSRARALRPVLSTIHRPLQRARNKANAPGWNASNAADRSGASPPSERRVARAEPTEASRAAQRRRLAPKFRDRRPPFASPKETRPHPKPERKTPRRAATFANGKAWRAASFHQTRHSRPSHSTHLFRREATPPRMDFFTEAALRFCVINK